MCLCEIRKWGEKNNWELYSWGRYKTCSCSDLKTTLILCSRNKNRPQFIFIASCILLNGKESREKNTNTKTFRWEAAQGWLLVLSCPIAFFLQWQLPQINYGLGLFKPELVLQHHLTGLLSLRVKCPQWWQPKSPPVTSLPFLWARGAHGGVQGPLFSHSLA